MLWEYLPEGTPRAHWAQEMDGVLYLADLGNDRVYRFSLENGLPSGAPQPIRLPAGSGPRQPLSLGGGSFAVVCELDGMLRFFSRDGACLAELCASGRTGDKCAGRSMPDRQRDFCGKPRSEYGFRIPYHRERTGACGGMGCRLLASSYGIRGREASPGCLQPRRRCSGVPLERRGPEAEGGTSAVSGVLCSSAAGTGHGFSGMLRGEKRRRKERLPCAG